jgi:hypothetical protein
MPGEKFQEAISLESKNGYQKLQRNCFLTTNGQKQSHKMIEITWMRVNVNPEKQQFLFGCYLDAFTIRSLPCRSFLS